MSLVRRLVLSAGFHRLRQLRRLQPLCRQRCTLCRPYLFTFPRRRLQVFTSHLPLWLSPPRRRRRRLFQYHRRCRRPHHPCELYLLRRRHHRRCICHRRCRRPHRPCELYLLRRRHHRRYRRPHCNLSPHHLQPFLCLIFLAPTCFGAIIRAVISLFRYQLASLCATTYLHKSEPSLSRDADVRVPRVVLRLWADGGRLVC